MALTVTPGGSSDDSLLSLADFESHCTNYGHDVSSYSDALKEQSLRRMTIWVEGLGSRGRTVQFRWPGQRATATQSRVFPRTGAYRPDGTALDDETIPLEAELAVMEATVYDLANPGVLQAALTNPSELYLKKQKIGELEEEYAIDYKKPWDENRPILPVVLDILSGLLVLEEKNKYVGFIASGPGATDWD